MAAGYCMYCGTAFTGSYRFCMGCGRSLEKQLAEQAEAREHERGESGAIAATRVRPLVEQPSPEEQSAVVTSAATAIPGLDLEAIFASQDEDDDSEPATKVYGAADDDQGLVDDDVDGPTLVFATEPQLTLRRLSNGEELRLELPAVIGRGSAATVRVAGNRYISRVHALIEKAAEGYVIRDQASSNRTMLNGRSIAASTPQPLKNGDHIVLADEEFVFQVTESDSGRTGLGS